MEDMHTNASAGISRRTFISGSAIAGTLAALGLAGCAPKTGTEKEMPATGASTSDISWDEECEVLVVGSGYSGLAAAIEAKNAGADVKIIEKMNRVGSPPSPPAIWPYAAGRCRRARASRTPWTPS